MKSVGRSRCWLVTFGGFDRHPRYSRLDAARYKADRRSVITTAFGTDGTMGTTKWEAYPADHDGYLFPLSTSVDSNASFLLPGGLKDTLGTHFREIVGCEYRGCLSKSPDVKDKHRPWLMDSIPRGIHHTRYGMLLTRFFTRSHPCSR